MKGKSEQNTKHTAFTVFHDNQYFIACSCGCVGPTCETEEEAIEKWECHLNLDEVKHITAKVMMKKEDGYAYKCSNGLFVVQSVSMEDDGQGWIHTSFSRKSRMPEYKDIKYIKEVFIGKGKEAIMVLPCDKYHINIHPFCLHLFTPAEKNPLPDFTHGMGTL